METKFTPMPWLITNTTVYALQDVPGKYINGKIQQENRFYAGIQGPCSEDEKLANAKLIAAAPELFNACIEALKELRYHNWQNTNTFNLIQDAIAKATSI